MTILIRLIKSSILKLRLRAKEHSNPLFYPMSKTFRSIRCTSPHVSKGATLNIGCIALTYVRAFAFTALLFLFLFNNSNAQDIEAFIKIDSDKPNKVAISGRFFKLKDNKNLSFLLNYGNISGLGERISNVKVFDKKNKEIITRRMMAGEYLADDAFTKWSYQVDLTPPKQPFGVAHLSWLTAEGGILFLDDMLPQTKGLSRVNLLIHDARTMAPGWITEYRFPDKKNAVLPFFNEQLRTREESSVKTALKFLIENKWKFTDEMAFKMGIEVFKNYEQLFGSSVSPSVNINIRQFPFDIEIGNYEADTRGNNITIISSDMAFESESVQRLHEILRHEMFHLWIPNGVNLSGNYDWFYEGFALYQALRTGVALNRIRFDDYLDTLSRAYDIDRRQMQKLSLIDVSKNRWAGDNNTRVYVRGMLVAFLCDLALLEKSKGKRSVTDILRKLYEKHRPPSAETDGNAAVLSLLRSHTELTPIIDRNITGSESVDWVGLIKAAGLEVDPTAQTTNLKVTAKPTGRQKDLLDKLGYNIWRKLASK